MALVGGLSVGLVVRQRLIRGLDEAMLTAEANVAANLAGAEAALSSALGTLRDRLDEGASNAAILADLKKLTDWMRGDDYYGSRLLGIYGYLRGEFIDGFGLNPGPGYIPQTQPWFDSAVRSQGGKTAYTEPYADSQIGRIVMSAVREVRGRSGAYYGFLVIDLDMSWFKDYVRSLGAAGGAGLILNQHLTVVAHPAGKFAGRPLGELGEGYREIRDALLARREISVAPIRDLDGGSAVASFRQMANGWYIGVVVPNGVYYRDARRITAILSLLSLVLASALSGLLTRLTAAKMRADEANRDKSAFLARISHEIRTPMNAVIGFSELGLATEGLPPAAAERFVGIRQAGRGLLAIINELLDFSKIESGTLEIVSVPYDLTQLLQEAGEATRALLADSGKPISFAVQVAPSVPGRLRGDETRVRQILLNLLSNAVKYTPEGFVTLSADGETDGDSVLLKFQVADSGIGLRPEDMRNLFGDFVRFEAARNRRVEGAGLGLAIARKLCLALGGELTVKSEYGAGSTFTAAVRQGLALAAPETATPPEKAGAAGDGQFVAPAARVLLVDDLRTNLLVALGLLGPYGLTIESCGSGEEAVALAAKNEYDLILMDHMMPGMDGLEAAAAIRALGEKGRRVPIVALTANAMSGMRETFLAGGMNDFLSKPIDPARLDEILRRWLPEGKRLPPPPAGSVSQTKLSSNMF